MPDTLQITSWTGADGCNCCCDSVGIEYEAIHVGDHVAVGSPVAVSARSNSGGLVTLTVASGHGIVDGDYILISGVAPGPGGILLPSNGYDTYPRMSAVAYGVTATTISYAQVTGSSFSEATTVCGGTVTKSALSSCDTCIGESDTSYCATHHWLNGERVTNPLNAKLLCDGVAVTGVTWSLSLVCRNQLFYTVTRRQRVSGTATLTIGSHILEVGDEIKVNFFYSGDTDASWNTATGATVAITAVTATTISYNNSGYPDYDGSGSWVCAVEFPTCKDAQGFSIYVDTPACSGDAYCGQGTPSWDTCGVETGVNRNVGFTFNPTDPLTTFSWGAHWTNGNADTRFFVKLTATWNGRKYHTYVDVHAHNDGCAMPT
jgi:hypothetical protein